MSKSRVFGVWFGGYGSYAEGYVSRDLEVWESEEDAKDSLVDRYAHGHWQSQPFQYVNQESSNALTPAVGEDSRIEIYLSNPTEEFESIPDYVLVLSFDEEDNVTAVRDSLGS